MAVDREFGIYLLAPVAAQMALECDLGLQGSLQMAWGTSWELVQLKLDSIFREVFPESVHFTPVQVCGAARNLKQDPADPPDLVHDRQLGP